MDCPIVSCVVPCRNEADQIEISIRSILAQQPPEGGFEVIVADGMSDDGTRRILERIASEDPRLQIVDNPSKITPCAMNEGIRHARGRYIAIMGAHNRYAPDYLARSLEVLTQTGADNVGGAMICEATNWVQSAIAAAHHSRFSAGGAKWHDPAHEGRVDTVFGGFYRRAVFDEIGFFDEELVRNQDDELNLRLSRAGGKIWQSPRIKSWYKPRSSLLALFKQQLQYGYWKVRVIQKRKIPASIRHLVPACFVFATALLPFLYLWWYPAIWIWTGVLGSYLLCSLTASFSVATKSGWKFFFILPLVFGCYHLAYGYGFLRGLWDFVVLRRGPRKDYMDLSRAVHQSKI